MTYILLGYISAKEYLEKEFGKLTTNEVIITDERIAHIKIRHKEDYNLFFLHIENLIINPDFVIKDTRNRNTVFMIKKLENTNLNAVIKLAVDNNNGYKNSVITFYRMREKNLLKFLKRNERRILYKKE